MPKTPKQIATETRSYLRAAQGGRVRLEWLRLRLGVSVEQVVDAIPLIETKSFRLVRISGQGASLAMA